MHNLILLKPHTWVLHVQFDSIKTTTWVYTYENVGDWLIFIEGPTGFVTTKAFYKRLVQQELPASRICSGGT